MVSGRKPDLERRQQVLQLHSQGLPPKEIAKCLGITRQAVTASLKSAERAAQREFHCCRCGTRVVSAGVLPRDAGRTFCVPCLRECPEATFGQRLRAFRLAAGMTRKELAQAAQVHNSTVKDYEEDEQFPRSAVHAALAQALGLTAERLGRGGPVPGRRPPGRPVAQNGI